MILFEIAMKNCHKEISTLFASKVVIEQGSALVTKLSAPSNMGYLLEGQESGVLALLAATSSYRFKWNLELGGR